MEPKGHTSKRREEMEKEGKGEGGEKKERRKVASWLDAPAVTVLESQQHRSFWYQMAHRWSKACCCSWS